MRLSGIALSQAFQFSLEIHSCTETDALAALVPERLSALVGCDRVSFNTIYAKSGSYRIVPSPVPGSWPKYGEIYQRHFFDHPVLKVPELSVISLDDPPVRSSWARSVLRNEYFAPLGIRRQLAVTLPHAGSSKIGIGINRETAPFRERERQLVALVAPHIATALRSARRQATLRALLLEAPPGASDPSMGAFVMDRHTLEVEGVTKQAQALIALVCQEPLESGRLPPREIRHWLRSSMGAPRAEEQAPLRLQSARGMLELRAASSGSYQLVVSVRRRSPEFRRHGRLSALTMRESEVLSWIAEGKRNAEIALILGVSARTVGKHVEHLLEKLGAETRTAAARHFAELSGEWPRTS